MREEGLRDGAQPALRRGRGVATEGEPSRNQRSRGTVLQGAELDSSPQPRADGAERPSGWAAGDWEPGCLRSGHPRTRPLGSRGPVAGELPPQRGLSPRRPVWRKKPLRPSELSFLTVVTTPDPRVNSAGGSMGPTCPSVACALQAPGAGTHPVWPCGAASSPDGCLVPQPCSRAHGHEEEELSQCTEKAAEPGRLAQWLSVHL